MLYFYSFVYYFTKSKRQLLAWRLLFAMSMHFNVLRANSHAYALMLSDMCAGVL
jgi:hypothetical protein